MTVALAGITLEGVNASGKKVAIQQGESCNVVGTFYDGSAAIAKASLSAVTCSLFLESTGASINSRKDQSILDANGGTITAEGVLTLRLDAADNPIVGTVDAGDYEAHILRVMWAWNDGVSSRTGKQEIRLWVQALETVT